LAHGGPWAPWLWGVSEEPNDIRHVGYQFYSVFSTENKYRVAIPLRFHIRLPHDGPWGSGGPLGEVFEEPNDKRHIGYQFHLVLSTENEDMSGTPL
jgi:hypothetical protein